MPVTAESLRLQAELRALLDEIVDTRTRDTVRAWVEAWDEIAGDLQDALEELIAAADGGTVTRRILLRNRRLQKALRVVADRLDLLVRSAGVSAVGDLQRIVAQAGEAQARIIAAQLPARQQRFDLEGWSRVDRRAIAAIVQRTTRQITAAHWPLSDQAYTAVRRELIRGVAAGSNPRETARRMVRRAERGFNGGLTRAVNIARTEQLDAHRKAAQLGQNLQVDVIAGWVWLASLSPRTCRACLAMHGRVFTAAAPGPNGHQQCRCSRAPKTKSWAELGFEGLDEPGDDVPDADEFFAGLSGDEQERILGKAGFRSWRSGDFPRDKWAVNRDNPGWRDSWVPAAPANPPGVNRPKPPKSTPPGHQAPAAPSRPTPPTPPTAPALPPGLPASQYTDADLITTRKHFRSLNVRALYTQLGHHDPAVVELARLEVEHRRAGQATPRWVKTLPVQPETGDLADDLADDIAAVNPNYSTGLPEWTRNCPNTTTALELRRRGYATTAAPLPGGRRIVDVVADWLAEPESLKTMSWAAADRLIRSYGDGARGAITVQWKAGTGHIFNWEVADGRIRWSDAQPGFVDYTGFINTYRQNSTGRLHVIRLDHLQVPDALAGYVNEGSATP